jgi:hypothetical protein
LNQKGERMSEIVKRLYGTPLYDGSGEASDLGEQAADTITRLTARVAELEEGLSGVFWMAEEWFEHGGDETTLADDYERQIDTARAALTPAPEKEEKR